LGKEIDFSGQVIADSGVIKYHDMQLFRKRAKAAEFLRGETNFNREIVAKHFGL